LTPFVLFSIAFVTSQSTLTLGPDFYQILEDLDRLGDIGGHGLALAEVEHEHGREADGQVLRVHLVAGTLRRHAGQVVHDGEQAVLKMCSKFVLQLFFSTGISETVPRNSRLQAVTKQVLGL
jgi:hypothetical protein